MNLDLNKLYVALRGLEKCHDQRENFGRINVKDLCDSSEISELFSTCINRFLALVCILREDNFEKKGR